MYKPNEERFWEEVDRPGFESHVTTVRDGNGDVIAVEVHSKDESRHFNELSEDEQDKVLAWIKANVKPRQTPLKYRTSYGMKHVLERRTNIYMTNNQFKEAMLRCGFYPVQIDALNWWYSISKASPIFRVQDDGHQGILIPECVMVYPDAEWEFEHGAWQCSNCGREGTSGNCWYDFDYEPTLWQCPHCGAIMKKRNNSAPTTVSARE